MQLGLQSQNKRLTSILGCRSAGDAQPSPSLNNGGRSQVIANKERIYKQARKLGGCDSYLQSETINDPTTH